MTDTQDWHDTRNSYAQEGWDEMKCYDCEQDPCICGDLFPFARIRTGDGKVYDHNGGLLLDPAVEAETERLLAERRANHDCPYCGGAGELTPDLEDNIERLVVCYACRGTGVSA